MARDAGLGPPVGRFLRSPRVQGAIQLAVCGLYSALATVLTYQTLERSDLPPAWRWILVPLVLIALMPFGRAGNVVRLGLFVPFFVAGLVHSTSHHPREETDLVVQAAMNAFWALVAAGYAHEGWAKLGGRRPKRQDDGLGSGPIRVHTGRGIP